MFFLSVLVIVGFSENIRKTLEIFDGYFVDNLLPVIVPLFAEDLHFVISSSQGYFLEWVLLFKTQQHQL